MNPLVTFYQDEVLPLIEDKNPSLKRMAGNVDSPVLFLAQHPTDEEYDNQIPLSDEKAAVLNNLFEDIIPGFNIGQRCLILAGSMYGDKPSKASHVPAMRFAVEFSKNPKSVFVCLGSSNFKHLFGHGKKPSDSALKGRSVRIKELNHRPVFYFPDIDCLEDRSNGLKGKEWGRAKGFWNDSMNEFRRLISNFSSFLKTEI